MKKIILFVSAILFCFSGFAFDYSINGTFGSKLQASVIYLHINGMLGQGNEVMPVPIVGGKFSYKGTADEPRQCLVSWEKTLPQDKSTYFSFILDKGSNNISIPGALSSAQVTGSKANSDLLSFVDLQKELQPAFEKFNQDAQLAMTGSKNIDSIRVVFMPRLDSLKKDAKRREVDFVKANRTAFISMLVIPELVAESKNYFLADSLFQLLSPEVKSTPSGKAISDRITAEKRFSVGAIAPDFEQNDMNNKPVKLSSLRGKYVLIDFWASWCGPCRQENPNVVENYNQFKDKGFTVLGVSLDSDKAKWLQAVAADGLSWQHVSDLKYWNNEVARLYLISEIPRNFLLDATGKIIARDLRGPELKRVLTNVLNKP